MNIIQPKTHLLLDINQITNVINKDQVSLLAYFRLPPHYETQLTEVIWISLGKSTGSIPQHKSCKEDFFKNLMFNSGKRETVKAGLNTEVQIQDEKTAWIIRRGKLGCVFTQLQRHASAFFKSQSNVLWGRWQLDYYDDHVKVYINIELLLCTSETNMMLYVNCISIFKKCTLGSQ